MPHNFVANAMLTLNYSPQDTSKGTVRKSIITIVLYIENDLPVITRNKLVNSTILAASFH